MDVLKLYLQCADKIRRRAARSVAAPVSSGQYTIIYVQANCPTYAYDQQYNRQQMRRNHPYLSRG